MSSSVPGGADEQRARLWRVACPIAGVVAVVALVAGIWAIRSGRLSFWRPLDRSSQASIEQRARQETSWSQVAFTALRDVSHTEFIRLAELAIEDRDGVMTLGQRQALAETLASHLALRVSGDIDAYIALADSEPTAWIGPDDDGRTWMHIDYFFEARFGEKADRSSPKAALGRIMQYAYDNEGARLSEIGQGPLGFTARVARRYTRNLLDGPPLFTDTELMHFTNSPSGRAFFFRKPRTSADSVLREHRSILVAEVFAIVKTEADARNDQDIWHNWRSVWYWDPASGGWVCSSMGFTGWWRQLVCY
jgi:hypothetical protein